MTEEDVRNIRSDQIALMVEKYYAQYEELHYLPFQHLVEQAIAKFLDTDLSLEEINVQLDKIAKEKIQAKSQQYDDASIQQNHEMIYSRLKQLITLCNKEGIDYHLAGALSAYVTFQEESFRPHHDIDIHLNERDIEKFQHICEQMHLSFQDNRLNSPRVLKDGIPSGNHEVVANDPESDFHIGVFCFERLVDGTIISKGYYHDENNQPCAREVIISSDLAKEIYSKKPVLFSGIPVFVTSPEYIYSLKSYTKNEKDKIDLEFLEKRIDFDRLARIRELSKNGKFVQCVPVTTLPSPSKINHQSLENDNSELSKMLVETAHTSGMVEEKSSTNVRQYTKKKKEVDGFTTKDAILIALVVVVVLTLIVLLILTK